jgi:hypothetical protein
MAQTKRHRTFRKKAHNKTRKMRGGVGDYITTDKELRRSWVDTKSWVVSGDDGIRYFKRVKRGETAPPNMDKEYLVTSKKDLETKLTKYVRGRSGNYSVFPLEKE